MIRVLAVSDASEVMGTEHSLLNLAAALPRYGVHLLLAARSGGSLETAWCGMGLRFCSLVGAERQGFRPNTGEGYHAPAQLAQLPVRTVQSVARLSRLIRSERPDVIHSNSLMTHIDCATAGRLTGTSTVLELHEIVAPGAGRFAMGAAVRTSGTAIAVSNAVRNQLPAWARSHCVVVPQGVDPRRFPGSGDTRQWRRRLAASLDAPIVAAVGRIDPEKGLDTLVKAVAIARRNGIDLQLALVGSPSKDDGAYLGMVTGLARQLLGCAFRVIPQVDDVPGVLGAVDILACPSPAEPFGLILLEAQSSGVAVVACASGGPVDFIVDDETGVLVPPNNVPALAAALERLAREPDRRERLACTGQTRARRTYSIDARADKVAALYREVASR